MKEHHGKVTALPVVALLFFLALVLGNGCTKERIVRGEIKPIQLVSHPSFQNIDSVVVDDSGRIFISDIHGVMVFNPAGEKLATIGTQGSGDGEFSNEVIGLAINSLNELYVVDQDGFRVQVFDSEGKFLRCFGEHGQGNGQFLEPQGIVIDQLDLVYISDKLRNDIQVFSRGGEFLYQLGMQGTSGARLNEPESMAIHDEKLYVADEENQRIQIYGLRGAHFGHLPHSGVFALNPQLEASLDDVPHHTDVENKYHRFLDGDIEGIVFDPMGLLFALNEDAGEIMVFHKEIMIGIFTSTLPIVSGDGLSMDSQHKHLYVVDQGNARVQIFEIKVIEEMLGLN